MAKPKRSTIDGLYPGEVLWWALRDSGRGWDADRYLLAVAPDGTARLAMEPDGPDTVLGEGTDRYTLLEVVDVPARTLPDPGRDVEETYEVPRDAQDARTDPQVGDSAWYQDVEYPYNAEYGAFVRPPNPQHGTLPIAVGPYSFGVRVYPAPGSVKTATRTVRKK